MVFYFELKELARLNQEGIMARSQVSKLILNVKKRAREARMERRDPVIKHTKPCKC